MGIERNRCDWKIFMWAHEERFGVLELRVQARHGGEKFEIIFPG